MKPIEAAGGVVVDLSRKKPRYLVVHRPDRDDWAFPKGKLKKRETHRDAALREVFEETGLECEILHKLDRVERLTENGNPKHVQYWLMEPMSGSFTPNDEVDAAVWLKRSQALGLLSYGRDQKLLANAHLQLANYRRKPPRFSGNADFVAHLERAHA